MNIIIDDLSTLNPQPNQFVAIDLEIFTNKGDEKHLHRPHTGKFACLSVCDDPTDVDNSRRFVYTKSDYVLPVLEKLQNCVWVMQNGKFDITHLRRWAKVLPRKRYFDTMFCERILYNGYYDSFSLKSLARRYLSIELSKEARETFTGATELTREQIEYAANDPFVTLQTALKQKKLMDEDDRRIWTEIDCPAMWAFLDFQGFAIDVEKWKALAQSNKVKQDELDAQLPINPRSPKQVVGWLATHGFTRLPDSQEKTLEKFIKKFPDTQAAQVARNILDSRMYGKRASTYGTKFIEDYLEHDGDVSMIYCNYDISRAETGRTASSDPNMQNIPARETKEFRECFVARPGNKLIVADYSAQEPRLSAYVSQDEQMLQWFKENKSIYTELGKIVFGKEITKKDPEYARTKSTILGLNYGMSEHGLAEREGITKDEARELINEVLNALPGLDDYMDKQRKNKVKVTTPFGRKVWLNPYMEQVERNALNSPIQGGAADMMKKALASIHQNWKFDCPFGVVGYIHDEAVLDVPAEIAEDVRQFVKEQMETTATSMVNNQIPFLADVSIGESWADK